jgi:hypothetical protein
LANKNKIDEDFNKFNLDIEHTTEKEICRLHEEISSLTEKAHKISEELLNLSSVEKKRS